eukprot:508750-Pleurochrysis_carterae.AAC.2
MRVSASVVAFTARYATGHARKHIHGSKPAHLAMRLASRKLLLVATELGRATSHLEMSTPEALLKFRGSKYSYDDGANGTPSEQDLDLHSFAFGSRLD